jgi:two-component system sensor histidine kinase KdpD
LRLTPYLVTATVVAAVGLAAYVLTRVVPLPHVSVLFLAAVILSAALWGFGPSVFAAVLSIGAASFFFYSPIFSFRVADPQQLADLAAFLVVAAFTSRLAATVRARAIEARRRQQNLARLLQFSERLAAAAGEHDLHLSVLEYLAPVLGRPIYLLLAGEGRIVTPADAAEPPQELRAAAARVMAGGEPALPGWRFEMLATAQAPIGVVAAQGPSPSADPEYARALTGQAALAMERARLRHEIAEARVKVQGEALRQALLNSVSHDLRTPLAAILGSATALESFGARGEERARRELVATIREESERLAAYIENLLDLSRIRAGEIAPRLELVELSDIVDAALRRKHKALDARRVRLDLPPDLPMLKLDLFLMEHALANVLDNAARYSPAGSTLSVSARVHGGEVVLEIADAGSGIQPDELGRIFEPFYRSDGSPSSGTGLGLAICRAFVEANGGTVSASSAGRGRGATLALRLPVPEAGVPSETAVVDE